MRNPIIRFVLVLVCIFAAGPVAAAPSHKATTAEYTISVIPFYSPEKIWTLYTPFIDYLKKTTGKPWALKLFPTHEALLMAICEGDVSLALLGPVPLGRVMDRCGAEPVLVALGKDGSPFYHSVIVSTDPMVDSLEGLRGKRLGFFKGSTAAHILPRKLLRQANLGRNDFGMIFFEGQDHIVNSLLQRQIVAAGIKETLYQRFKNDPSIKVLAISEPVPNFAFVAAPGATPAVKKLFVDALLHLSPARNELDRKQVSAWDDEIRNGFIRPTPPFKNAVMELLIVTDEVMREDR